MVKNKYIKNKKGVKITSVETKQHQRFLEPGDLDQLVIEIIQLNLSNLYMYFT